MARNPAISQIFHLKIFSMKSTIKNFLFATAAVLFTCSFTETTRLNADFTALEAAPVGGAYLIFAGKFGGEITPQEIQGQTSLGVDGCAKGSRIFQYTLEVTKNGKMSSYQASSNELTKEMISQLRSLSARDEFEFKKIKAYLPNGKDVVDVRGNAFIVAAKKA